ncbi:MAG: hypothetical protein HGB11_08285 [Chlorobiales bacterium]|nr:hypothetical protein [Chlorobiales bacterium]
MSKSKKLPLKNDYEKINAQQLDVELAMRSLSGNCTYCNSSKVRIREQALNGTGMWLFLECSECNQISVSAFFADCQTCKCPVVLTESDNEIHGNCKICGQEIRTAKP